MTISTRVRRRTVLASGTAGAALTTLGTGAESEAAGRRFFRHGVASGDPRPHAAIIWTRVTPTRASRPGSGTGPRVDVGWEVARDPRFRKVVRRGTFATGPGRDHTVKLDVTGLRPAAWYHYRFTFRGTRCRTGRLRTAPAANAAPRNLRFGVVSCANWQAGYFAAYRGIARRHDLHAVLHLGDYLYEYGPGQYGYGQGDRDIRRHTPAHEMVSLADYRQRHAQYKTDPDLQALHAVVPFIVTWDDHEVADGSWARGAYEHEPRKEGSFARRVRAAQQAYDEWMPVRLSGTAVAGDGRKIYRRLQFGKLADLSMLDLRTYRSERAKPDDPAVDAPGRTIAGEHQLAWLGGNLSTSPCRWKLVGNPVMIAPVRMPPRPMAEEYALGQVVSLTPLKGSAPNTDEWDGYTSDRRRLLERIETEGTTDVVFLTGDVHTAWASEVPGTSGVPVATEMVCSSLTSNNIDDFMGASPRTISLALEAAIQQENPHVRFVNLDDHGYSVLRVTADAIQMDWFAVTDRRDRRAAAPRLASWAVRSGEPRIVAVDREVRV